DYVRRVESLARADPRVVLPGYVYGTVLEELYANAAAFVLPSSLEGLPLTLLEACAYGTPVVVSDIAPNLEVVGGDAAGHHVFHVGDRPGLTAALGRALGDVVAERAAARELRRRVLDAYRWDAA